MNKLIAVVVVLGGLTVGIFSATGVTIRAAFLWAVGTSVAGAAMKQVVCRDGTEIRYDARQISFSKGGKIWGPYNRT